MFEVSKEMVMVKGIHTQSFNTAQLMLVAGSWALQAVYRLQLEFASFDVGIFGTAKPSCAAVTAAVIVATVLQS